MPPTPRAATSAFALMPKQLSRIKLPPIIQMTARAMLMKILDAGSGSGILSFVCNKLGAKHVLGIDIDPIAVDVAGENRDVNHIPAEAVEFKCGNVLEDQKLVESIGANYDIVVANILADVIIPMSAVVQKFMKDDGIFISSGIINIKEDEVREALLDNNFDIVDTVYMNDWVSFVAKKHV